MNRKRFLVAAAAAAAAAWPRAASAQSFAQALRASIEAIPGTVGLVARTMADGPPLYAYNDARSFPSASTIKLTIMLTAFLAAESDPAVLHRSLSFDRSRLIGGSDFMSGAGDGTRFTVRDLIVPMIQVSDNTAANMLIDAFGFERINAVIRNAGMRNTQLKRHFLDYSAVVRHMDNRTTPADMAHLLFELERAVREGVRTVAAPDSAKSMIGVMLGQTDRATIPAGVPRGVAVANKTGELSRSRSDVAIVEPYGDSPYILCVYASDLSSPQEAYPGITRISRIVYGQVANSGL